MFIRNVARFENLGIKNGHKKSDICYGQPLNIYYLFCRWFDVFNAQTKYPHNSKKAKSAFGLEHTELQMKILKDMTEAVQNLICNGHVEMIDFQHGIVVSNVALPQLYDQLVMEYQVKIAICLV